MKPLPKPPKVTRSASNKRQPRQQGQKRGPYLGPPNTALADGLRSIAQANRRAQREEQAKQKDPKTYWAKHGEFMEDYKLFRRLGLPWTRDALIGQGVIVPSAATKAYILAENMCRPDKGGGITISINDASQPTEGYAVAVYPDREGVETNFSWVGLSLAWWIHRNSRLLMEPGMCMGVWYDPATELIYYDIVAVVKTKRDARLLCEMYDQQAFYDLAQGEVCNVQ